MLKRFFSVSSGLLKSHNRVKPNKKPITYKPVVSQVESLRARGFLRSVKAYEPPADVGPTIEKIVKDLGGVKNFSDQKFELLTQCQAAFSHSVPNSQLFEIKTVDDVVNFYATPVDTRTPYETLDGLQETVPNLHVIQDYRRFNPETDGVSAFPKSSTIVTGLKYRKKYKGYVAKSSWP